MRIALVSRELYPYLGGGIAPIVTAAARHLSQIAEVTVFTSDGHRAAHQRLAAAGDPRLLPPEVRIVWVPEMDPDEVGDFLSFMHAYSARVDRALRDAYPAGGPELIEFCDYLAEGFVTVQARHTSDPWLASTQVAVRLHTTSEFCAVLDGHLPDDSATLAVHDAERYTLRHADRLLWSGGDVLETYRRYYGAEALAPAERIPDAFLEEAAPQDTDDLGEDRHSGPLRLLFIGRAERRKGVANLMRAFTTIGRLDVELTLLGGDTLTGPLQTSLRHSLELMAADDPRIHFADPVPRHEVSEHLRRADVVVVPSLWECWPNVAREALLHNRPVLGTPVGGLTEMVVPGRTGWLTRDTSPPAIAQAIDRLADRPQDVRGVIRAGTPREHGLAITDRRAFLDRYAALVAKGPRPRPRRPRTPPEVTVVIPYFRLERHLDETLGSVLAQTHPRLSVVIVNDGSLRDEDAFLYELDDERVTVVTQVNSGLSAARNLGARLARSEYVLPLDADDVVLPTFVERCVDALERDDALAYVTTYVQYMKPDGELIDAWQRGYMPVGNWSRLIERNNVGGTCAAVFRRRLFERGFGWSHDLTSYEDWLLYLQLARAELHGAVIPERLLRYRVRPDSMMRTDGRPRTELIVGEIAAHLRESEVEWVASGR